MYGYGNGGGGPATPTTSTAKLHHVLSTAILGTCIFIIATQKFYGTPMNCMTPAGNATAPAMNNWCWGRSYLVIPKEREEMERMHKGYFHPVTNFYNLTTLKRPNSRYRASFLNGHRWAEFAMLIQAFLCFLPRFLWKFCWEDDRITMLRHRISKITEVTDDDRKAEEKRAIFEELVILIDTNRFNHLEYALKYMFCEFLNFLLALAQFLVLISLFGVGLRTLFTDFIEGDLNTRNNLMMAFPRIAKCDTPPPLMKPPELEDGYRGDALRNDSVRNPWWESDLRRTQTTTTPRPASGGQRRRNRRQLGFPGRRDGGGGWGEVEPDGPPGEQWGGSGLPPGRQVTPTQRFAPQQNPTRTSLTTTARPSNATASAQRQAAPRSLNLTLYCAMPGNDYIVKMYIFLAFHFLILSIVSALPLFCYRIPPIFSSKLRVFYLKRKGGGGLPTDDADVIKHIGYGEWFLLTTLRENIDPFSFQDVIQGYGYASVRS